MTGSYFTTSVLLLLISPIFSHFSNAHIQFLFPPGINSVFDPQTLEVNKDYSMTAPLLADGSNYPCKGYNTATNINTLNSVATLEAGKVFNVTLAGTATHMGGSCQFSLSYDGGETWAVISSIEGGCPLSLAYDVPIPSDVPSMKKALFAWTWFNKVGNREMYMNCAIVDIEGGSGNSFTAPAVVRANTFADGTCIMPEGTEFVYPAPGDNVQFFGSVGATSPATVLANCPQNYSTTVTVGPSGSSSGGDVATSSKSQPSVAVATKSSAPTTAAIVVASTTSASTAATTDSIAEATSSSSAASTVSTEVSAADSGAAYLVCTSETTFQLCGGGTCTDMGSVADGTVCVDGAIAMAPSARMRRSHRKRVHGPRRL